MIDPSQEISENTVEKLYEELSAFSKGYDEFEAIINVAGLHYPPNTKNFLRKLKREQKLEEVPIHPLSIASPDVFTQYARI